MKAMDWLAQFRIWSRYKMGEASRSEMRQWFKDGAVVINAETVAFDEPMDFPMISVVLFPKGKRITLL